jgi:hypothetical protein
VLLWTRKGKLTERFAVAEVLKMQVRACQHQNEYPEGCEAVSVSALLADPQSAIKARDVGRADR